MAGYYELPWTEVAAVLRSRTEVPAALRAADLLDRARPRWERVVVADLRMHDLAFAARGQGPPFTQRVTVGWSDDVYELQLLDGLTVVTADRCTRANVDVVLDAFLVQIVNE